jgi:hypothetical protein
MGAAASITSEMEKPLDASDLTGNTSDAAVKEVSRLRKLMQPPTSGVLVDCGSGHTSMICYTKTPDGQTNQHAKLSIRNEDDGNYPLTDAFSNNSTSLFIDQLRQEMSKLNNFHPKILFVGATGGVRKAIENNKITSSQVDTFIEALNAAFSATVNVIKFAVLDGTTEASFELTAAQVIWGGENALLASPNIGLFSGGGQSMQLGRVEEEPLSFAFSTMVDAFEERAGASPDAWLNEDAWQKYESDMIAQVAAEQQKRPLFVGCYVGTAMNHRAAAYSDISGIPITVRDAVKTLRSSLPQFRSKTGPLYDKMMEGRTGGSAHKKYPLARITAMHTFRLATTLDMLFSPDAELFFAKSGLDQAGNSLECEWTLGAFLKYTEGM